MMNVGQFDDYAKFKRILLLFSGGLDTSFLVKFFSLELKCEVITVSFNLSGSKSNGLRKKALSLGAKEHIEMEATEEFLNEYCLFALKANARHNGAHPLSSSLSRPLMAKLAVKLACQLNCDAVMHGSSGWQNNPARFNNAFRALSKKVEVLTPILDLNIKREDEFEYLKFKGVVIEKKEDDLYSSDENIWSREIEDGNLENHTFEVSNEVYKFTNSIEDSPNFPEFVEIEFKHGTPVSLNGEKLPFIEIVKKLNQTGGLHGVGRFDFFEDRVSGVKMREIHESPAAHILILAHKDLENTLLPKRLLSVKNYVDQIWSETVCFGFWYHPLKKALDAFIEKSNEKINGGVRVKLYKGNPIVVARKVELLNLSPDNAQIPLRNFFDIYSVECRN